MKKSYLFISVIFIVFSYSQDSVQTIKNISDAAIVYKDTLVLFTNFDNYNVDSTIVNKLSKKFYATLNSFNGYKVIPDTALDSIFGKKNISRDSCYDDCLLETALELEAKYIIECRIGKTEKNITSYTLDTDFFRVDDGIIVSSSTYKVENEIEDLFDGVQMIISEILKKKKSTVLIRNKAKNVYNVSFDKIFIDDLDFQRSIFNNPLPISLFFLQNNILIIELFIGQKRNEVDFSKRDELEIRIYPHFKKIKYSPNSSYSLVIKEDGFLKNVSKYEIKFLNGRLIEIKFILLTTHT